MTRLDRPDAVIAAFLRRPQPDLPDPVFDAVRGEIHLTRQRIVIGPVAAPDAHTWRTVAAAAAVMVAVAVGWLGSRPAGGPGGLQPTPSPSPTPIAVPSPSKPTAFTSPLYGYAATIPAGWSTVAAVTRWDGRIQPAFDSAGVDAFGGPAQIVMEAFSGTYSGTLAAFVDDRIAANARDHADTCPPDALQVNEPINVGGQAGVLLGWNCGALINQALTLRDGVAYAFGFRDLGIKAARDPTDLALLQSVLDSIRFPATSASPSP